MDLYSLEIYEPDSDNDVLELIINETPFLPISRGDRLNTPGTCRKPGMVRVRDVEHIVWNVRGVIKHKVLLFTECVEHPAAPTPPESEE